MAPQRRLRLIRADDFVANSLEARADKLPPSEQAQAEYLRETAKSFRESGRPGMMSFWENAKDAEEYIHPDPASVKR
jgi:hypothetical protein